MSILTIIPSLVLNSSGGKSIFFDATDINLVSNHGKNLNPEPLTVIRPVIHPFLITATFSGTTLNNLNLNPL